MNWCKSLKNKNLCKRFLFFYNYIMKHLLQKVLLCVGYVGILVYPIVLLLLFKGFVSVPPYTSVADLYIVLFILIVCILLTILAVSFGVMGINKLGGETAFIVWWLFLFTLGSVLTFINHPLTPLLYLCWGFYYGSVAVLCSVGFRVSLREDE